MTDDKSDISRESNKNNAKKIMQSEHVLTCLSASLINEKSIRSGAKLAKSLNAKFTALFVETPEFSQYSKEDLKILRSNIRLAEQLGANIVTTYGNDILEQIIEYAKVSKVTKIILWMKCNSNPLFSMKDAFTKNLAKLYPEIEIFVIPDMPVEKHSKKSKTNKNINAELIIKDIIISISILFLATLLAYFFDFMGFEDSNLIMIYILAVLMTSLSTNHTTCSSISSILCVLIFNFCFIEPTMTFVVYDPEYIVTFVSMFITALISASLTQKVKNQAKQSAQKSYRTVLLLETSQKLQKSCNKQEIAYNTSEQLNRLLEKNIIFYIGSPVLIENPILLIDKNSNKTQCYKEELYIAEWVYNNNKSAGFSTTIFPESKCLYLPIRNRQKVFAVIGIDMKKHTLHAFEEGIMSAILNECALALEKEDLIAARKEEAIKLKQEQLRANLLRSISHDLRSPLTSISGNAGVLIGNSDKITESQKKKLYLDIYDDSMWLINLVENLLFVTRIENGTMELNLQTELIDEVITESLKHISRKSSEHNIIVNEENDLLMAKIDVKLIMQVIINLVDNAIKYTPVGSEIQITAKQEYNNIIISVSDNGKGIPDNERERLFDMFYTSKQSVSDGRRGMGLGLSLCKTIINAHGGSITVENNMPNGTVFKFTLKAEEVPIQ